jgi:hypothetical protein
MPEWLWMAVVAMFVVDAVVLVLVMKQRAQRTGFDLGKLHEMSKLVHDRIGEHLRANYSGNVDDLPRALRGLMPVVEQTLRGHGQQWDDATVRQLVTMSVAGHRFATRKQVEQAMTELDRTPEAQAA